MVKVRKAGVETPCLYLVDSANTKIYMEKIDGVTAKHFFQSEHAGSEGDTVAALKIAAEIGRMVAKMHDAQVVHGDLTTSNLMIRNGSQRVVAIDFGLASQQPLPEDKAVDLYVLERAFISTHQNAEPLVNEVMRAYKASSRKADATLHKLAEVRRRGRKREMFG